MSASSRHRRPLGARLHAAPERAETCGLNGPKSGKTWGATTATSVGRARFSAPRERDEGHRSYVHDAIRAIALPIKPGGEPFFTAIIDPNGQSGTFQQGLANTQLQFGEMQVRGTWSDEPLPGGGTLQPITLVAQQIDENNMNRVELVEHDDHTMQIYIIEVINGVNTYLAISSLLDQTNQLGDWWYLRFQFDGLNLSARAWKSGTREPTLWQVSGRADVAHTGSVAVRSANSASNVRPVVRFDDFWVQSIGFSLSVFLKIPRAQPGMTDTAEVFPLGKGDIGSSPVTVGNREYYFRYHADTHHLKVYVFNREGGFGAGQDIPDIDPDRWYHVVMELDPGDFNDTTAGINIYVNGRYRQAQAGSLYKGDSQCEGQCMPNSIFGNETTCGGVPSSVPNSTCWKITPVNGDGPFRLATVDASLTNRWFNGSFDEVAIVSRRLRCSEVSAIYNTSCQPTKDAITGLFATASSIAAPGNFANAAIDGSKTTSWESAFGDAQTITLDLGSVRDIAKAKLIWGARFPLAYQIQVSTDNVNWTTAVDITTTSGSGGIDDKDVNSTARYVRMFGITSANHLGYSLFEFQVFTCGVGPVDCSNSPPVAVVGPPQLVFPGQLVSLDGSNSFDPDNDPLANPFIDPSNPDEMTFTWRLASRPSGSTATDPNCVTSNCDTATLSPDILGTFVATLVVSDSNPSRPTQASASSMPASTILTVVRPQLVATTGISQAISIANALSVNDVTTVGNRQAFVNLISQADSDLQAGRIKQAIQKVNAAIIRTDGWSLRRVPDGPGPGRDWIVTRSQATALYGSLSSSLVALQAI